MRRSWSRRARIVVLVAVGIVVAAQSSAVGAAQAPDPPAASEIATPHRQPGTGLRLTRVSAQSLQPKAAARPPPSPPPRRTSSPFVAIASA